MPRQDQGGGADRRALPLEAACRKAAGSPPASPALYRTGWLLIFLLIVAEVLAAQDFEESRLRFQLYDDCAPVEVLVEDLPDRAADINLTAEEVSDLVEVRLRAARLYTEGHRPGWNSYLYVYVNLLGSKTSSSSFSISLDYRKYLTDTDEDWDRGMATTWHTGAVGYGDSDYILKALSDKLDDFILQYLRANEDACDPTPRVPKQ